MRIIFIYNANSSLIAGIFDVMKKATGNSRCALCDITWTLVKEKEEWKKVDRSLGVETIYYHRDDMPEAVRAYIEKEGLVLPIVLLETEGGYEALVTKPELGRCKGGVSCLKEGLMKALSKYHKV